MRVKKPCVGVNHPLLGGADMMNDRIKMAWVGLFTIKEKSKIVVNFESDDKQ